MTKFKEMKFWIGDDAELSERIQNILFGAGYKWSDGSLAVGETGMPSLYAHEDGNITYASGDIVPKTFTCHEKHMEINIDWMRSTKPDAVEPETPEVMTKEEAEQQISELKSYIEELDKPKRVRVYIKEDADTIFQSMQHMLGGVFDVVTIKVESNGEVSVFVHSPTVGKNWWFNERFCIAVEGSLEDLK
jgi:hypothetical protein